MPKRPPVQVAKLTQGPEHVIITGNPEQEVPAQGLVVDDNKPKKYLPEIEQPDDE